MIFNLNKFTQIMTLPCNKGHRRLFFQCWCWWWLGVTGRQLTLSHHARVVSTTLPGNCDSWHFYSHACWTRGSLYHFIWSHRPGLAGQHNDTLHSPSSLLCPHQRFVATLPSPLVTGLDFFKNQDCSFKTNQYTKQKLNKQIYLVCVNIRVDILHLYWK